MVDGCYGGFIGLCWYTFLSVVLTHRKIECFKERRFMFMWLLWNATHYLSTIECIDCTWWREWNWCVCTSVTLIFIRLFFISISGENAPKKSHAFISRLSKKTINQFQPFWFRSIYYSIFFSSSASLFFAGIWAYSVHWCPTPNIKFNVLGIPMKRMYSHILSYSIVWSRQIFIYFTYSTFSFPCPPPSSPLSSLALLRFRLHASHTSHTEVILFTETKFSHKHAR